MTAYLHKYLRHAIHIGTASILWFIIHIIFHTVAVSLPQECIADLVSADDGGNLCVWKSGEEFQLLNKIPGFV